MWEATLLKSDIPWEQKTVRVCIPIPFFLISQLDPSPKTCPGKNHCISTHSCPTANSYSAAAAPAWRLVRASTSLHPQLYKKAPWIPRWRGGQESACQWRSCRRPSKVRSLGREDPLEGEMASHPSILAWEIPRTEEPGGLQSMGVTELDTTEHACMHPDSNIRAKSEVLCFPLGPVTFPRFTRRRGIYLRSLRCSQGPGSTCMIHVRPFYFMFPSLTELSTPAPIFSWTFYYITVFIDCKLWSFSSY